MARLPDYYAILHVDPAAPTEVIRASYRTLMQRLRLHPDLGGDHDAASALNSAYATLKDPQRRAQYDADRRSEGGAPRRESARETAAGQSRPAADPQYSADGRSAPAAQKETGRDRSAASPRWVTGSGSPASARICPFCHAPATPGRNGSDAPQLCRECSAPLTLVRAISHDGAQTQRSVYRIAKDERLRVFTRFDDRSGIDAIVHDISMSGMRFSCAQELACDAVIRVDCDMCAAVARIAHVGERAGGVSQYGAEFLTVQFKRQRGSLLSVPV